VALSEVNLSEIILSTLNEVEGDLKKESIKQEKKQVKMQKKIIVNEKKSKNIVQDDKDFLINLKEKLLVLFEGLQDDTVDNKEDKVNIILNYLEYTLSSLETKINSTK